MYQFEISFLVKHFFFSSTRIEMTREKQAGSETLDNRGLIYVYIYLQCENFI